MNIRHLLTALFTFATLSVQSQTKIITDTLYYDDDKKGISDKAFASYYRIYQLSEDSSAIMPFRDFYITGEIRYKGSYKFIDPDDDSKSVFEGKYTSYYKSGQIESTGVWESGVLQGEYTSYYENGLINTHAYYDAGIRDGIVTQFSPDGEKCKQTEYVIGVPKDFYILSDKNGYANKFSTIDDAPIFESPEKSELQEMYKDGTAWKFYDKNGIIIAIAVSEIKDYGKYYRIDIRITNNSTVSIDFDPENCITSYGQLIENGHDTYQELKVYSADEYTTKVRNLQNLAIVLNSFAEGINASQAGHSTSNVTTYNPYTGQSYTSTVHTYNAAAAYQAQVIANNRIASYENALRSDRAVKEQGYLKRNTIQSGEIISGYVHIARWREGRISITFNIEGASYDFSFTTSKYDQYLHKRQKLLAKKSRIEQKTATDTINYIHYF